MAEAVATSVILSTYMSMCTTEGNRLFLILEWAEHNGRKTAF